MLKKSISLVVLTTYIFVNVPAVSATSVRKSTLAVRFAIIREDLLADKAMHHSSNERLSDQKTSPATLANRDLPPSVERFSTTAQSAAFQNGRLLSHVTNNLKFFTSKVMAMMDRVSSRTRSLISKFSDPDFRHAREFVFFTFSGQLIGWGLAMGGAVGFSALLRSVIESKATKAPIPLDILQMQGVVILSVLKISRQWMESLLRKLRIKIEGVTSSKKVKKFGVKASQQKQNFKRKKEKTLLQLKKRWKQSDFSFVQKGLICVWPLVSMVFAFFLVPEGQGWIGKVFWGGYISLIFLIIGVFSATEIWLGLKDLSKELFSWLNIRRPDVLKSQPHEDGPKENETPAAPGIQATEQIQQTSADEPDGRSPEQAWQILEEMGLVTEKHNEELLGILQIVHGLGAKRILIVGRAVSKLVEALALMDCEVVFVDKNNDVITQVQDFMSLLGEKVRKLTTIIKANMDELGKRPEKVLQADSFDLALCLSLVGPDGFKGRVAPAIEAIYRLVCSGGDVYFSNQRVGVGKSMGGHLIESFPTCKLVEDGPTIITHFDRGDEQEAISVLRALKISTGDSKPMFFNERYQINKPESNPTNCLSISQQALISALELVNGNPRALELGISRTSILSGSILDIGVESDENDSRIAEENIVTFLERQNEVRDVTGLTPLAPKESSSRYVRGTVQKMPVAWTNRFDAVTCFWLFQDEYNALHDSASREEWYQQAAKECARVTKPGQVMLIGRMPNWRYPDLKENFETAFREALWEVVSLDRNGIYYLMVNRKQTAPKANSNETREEGRARGKSVDFSGSTFSIENGAHRKPGVEGNGKLAWHTKRNSIMKLLLAAYFLRIQAYATQQAAAEAERSNQKRELAMPRGMSEEVFLGIQNMDVAFITAA